MASEVSVSNDEDLPEAEKVFNSLKYMESGKVLRPLLFPGDCKAETLKNFVETCGLKVVPGGKHWKVLDWKLLTTIPHRVKANGTCWNIIKKLNGHCKMIKRNSRASFVTYI